MTIRNNMYDLGNSDRKKVPLTFSSTPNVIGYGDSDSLYLFIVVKNNKPRKKKKFYLYDLGEYGENMESLNNQIFNISAVIPFSRSFIIFHFLRWFAYFWL